MLRSEGFLFFEWLFAIATCKRFTNCKSNTILFSQNLRMFALTENSSIFWWKIRKKGFFYPLNQFIHALTGFSLKWIYLLTDHSFAHFERKVGIFKLPHVNHKLQRRNFSYYLNLFSNWKTFRTKGKFLFWLKYEHLTGINNPTMHLVLNNGLMIH